MIGFCFREFGLGNKSLRFDFGQSGLEKSLHFGLGKLGLKKSLGFGFGNLGLKKKNQNNKKGTRPSKQ